KSWADFSEAWKKARTKSSEKSIHDLRVSTRRLIATLELTRSVSKHEEIPTLQRRFKKVLKSMGPLRDVQVQLENVSLLRQVNTIADFQRSLERRERRQIAGIDENLNQGTNHPLTKTVNNIRTEFILLHDKVGDARIHAAVERLLRLRRNEFLRTRRRFKPADEETLHRMRIALKKLRYTVEAAQPVIGDSAKELARNMQAFQQLL